jgi:hypothetical protein
MIACFTQTYGNDRFLNMLLLQYDKLANYLRNKCEIIIFSFHNSSTEFKERYIPLLKKIYDEKKLIVLEHSNISYLQSIRNSILYMRTRNVTHILQIQDDQHSYNSKENIQNIKMLDTIFEFVNRHKPLLLHIFSNEGDPKINRLPYYEKKTIDNVNYYKYNSMDFKKAKIYSWNDGTYIADIKLLQQMFFIKRLPENVWGLEMRFKYLFDRFRIYRWGIDKVIFGASNIYGKNINKGLSVEDNLKRFFGELDEWNIIKQKINHK